MYEAIEIFDQEESINLKEILKSCIYNYYKKYKSEKKLEDDLQSPEKHHIIGTTNNYKLQAMKGECNVLQVQ